MSETQNKIVNEWLSEYKTESTKHTKLVRLQHFLKWFAKSAQDFSELTPKEAKRKILEFQASEVEKKTPNNSILSYISSAKGFYGYANDIGLSFTRGQLVKPQKAVGYHEFSNGDLASIFEIAKTQYKALLAVATSGFSIADILRLDKQQIEATVKRAKEANERFAYIELNRKKTNAPSLLVLNPLALEWLSKWLAINKKPTLWTVKENAINRMLKTLAKTAIKNLEGTIKFHKIRGWTMRSLSKAGFNEFQIKYCIGKAIPLSDETYLRIRNEIEEKYPKIYDKYLSLEPTALAQPREKYVENLEQTVKKQQTEIEDLKTRLKAHGERIAYIEGFAQEQLGYEKPKRKPSKEG